MSSCHDHSVKENSFSRVHKCGTAIEKSLGLTKVTNFCLADEVRLGFTRINQFWLRLWDLKQIIKYLAASAIQKHWPLVNLDDAKESWNSVNTAEFCRIEKPVKLAYYFSMRIYTFKKLLPTCAICGEKCVNCCCIGFQLLFYTCITSSGTV